MKKKDIETLRNKPTAELAGKLREARTRLVDLRFDLHSGKLQNPKELKQIKKDVARILTFLNANKA